MLNVLGNLRVGSSSRKLPTSTTRIMQSPPHQVRARRYVYHVIHPLYCFVVVPACNILQLISTIFHSHTPRKDLKFSIGDFISRFIHDSSSLAPYEEAVTAYPINIFSNEIQHYFIGEICSYTIRSLKAITLPYELCFSFFFSR